MLYWNNHIGTSKGYKMHLGETLYTANVVDIEESADIEEASVATAKSETVAVATAKAEVSV
jgi:hypothetical protein